MRISIRGADWFYTVAGQGDPVLFLHGGFDSSANFTRLIETLSRDFRVVAVDRRGHGRTADTDAPFDYALMAEEVMEFALGIGLKSFHLLGYSDGANLGFHMGRGHPEAVKSLVAVSGNYKGLTGMTEAWLDIIRALSPEYVRDRMPGVVEQYLALNPAPDLETFVAKTKAIWTEEYVITKDKLGELPVRTLLIHGDRDIMLPEQAVEMHSLIPRAYLMMLPDTGHNIFQDFAFKTAAQAAIPVIREFLLTGFARHGKGGKE